MWLSSGKKSPVISFKLWSVLSIPLSLLGAPSHVPVVSIIVIIRILLQVGAQNRSVRQWCVCFPFPALLQSIAGPVCVSFGDALTESYYSYYRVISKQETCWKVVYFTEAISSPGFIRPKWCLSCSCEALPHIVGPILGYFLLPSSRTSTYYLIWKKWWGPAQNLPMLEKVLESLSFLCFLQSV